eukprot:scaffold11675_cov123-Cylindrotheca_fusiformis.AAC.3
MEGKRTSTYCHLRKSTSVIHDLQQLLDTIVANDSNALVLFLCAQTGSKRFEIPAVEDLSVTTRRALTFERRGSVRLVVPIRLGDLAIEYQGLHGIARIRSTDKTQTSSGYQHVG